MRRTTVKNNRVTEAVTDGDIISLHQCGYSVSEIARKHRITVVRACTVLQIYKASL